MMKVCVKVLGGLVGLCCLPGLGDLARADEPSWPQWRGPDRTNRSTDTGLIKEWPPEGPPLLWRASHLGAGYGSISIHNGRIFTLGDYKETSFLKALDMDGKPIWEMKVGSSGMGTAKNNYPGSRSTPTVSGDVVVGLGQFGELLCLEAETGNEKWRKNLVKDFGAQVMSQWGFAESPLIDGDRVICTPGGPGGTMLALDIHTGETVWRTREITDSAAYSSIIPAEIDGQKQYIQLTEAHVFGVEPLNGAVLWKAPRAGKMAVIPTPVVSGNFVFVTSEYRAGCHLFKVEKRDGKFKATEVYANQNMANHHGGVVLVDGHVYGTSTPGILVCMELETGVVKWSSRAPGKGSLTYADGHLYVRSENAQVTLVEATPEGYREKGRFDPPTRGAEKTWSHPVVLGGKLYLRDQDVLLCYDLMERPPEEPEPEAEAAP